MTANLYTLPQTADLLSVGKRIVESWLKSGRLRPASKDKKGRDLFSFDDFKFFDSTGVLASKDKPVKVIPKKDYSVIELFADEQNQIDLRMDQ